MWVEATNALFKTKWKNEPNKKWQNPTSATPQTKKKLGPLLLPPGVAIIVEISCWLLVMEDNVYLA